jgi:hypothetical protein
MARLSEEEIDERLSGLEGWQRDGEVISKDFNELARRIEGLA